MARLFLAGRRRTDTSNRRRTYKRISAIRYEIRRQHPKIDPIISKAVVRPALFQASAPRLMWR